MNNIYRVIRYDWPLHFVLMVTNWLPDNVLFLRLRGLLTKPFFASCGSNLRLGRNITFYNPSKIHLGSDIYIALGCWFMAGEIIKICDEVIIGPYCVIVSSNHSRKNKSFRFGDIIQETIVIGKGSWIAAHVTLTAGTEIGSGSLVAAGAVVNSKLRDNVLSIGQPAKVVKEIEDYDR